MKNEMFVTIANEISKSQLIKAVNEYFPNDDILSISHLNNGLIVIAFDGIAVSKWYCNDSQKFINKEIELELIERKQLFLWKK